MARRVAVPPSTTSTTASRAFAWSRLSPVRHRWRSGANGAPGPLVTAALVALANRTEHASAHPRTFNTAKSFYNLLNFCWFSGQSTCKGESFELTTCKIRASSTCNPPKDHRQEKCDEYIRDKYGRVGGRSSVIKSRPAPSTTKGRECNLICERPGSRSGAYRMLTEDTRQIVPSGTPCSYDDPHSYCLLGKCYNVGCDGVLNSNKRFNECGVCDGSRTDCVEEHVTRRKTNKRAGRKSQHSNYYFAIPLFLDSRT